MCFQIVKNMTNPDVANATRMRINDDKTEDVMYYHPSFENSGQDRMGTSHMNAYHMDGSAVALTSTINTWYYILCFIVFTY